MSENEHRDVSPATLMDRREFIRKSAVGAGTLAAALAFHGYGASLVEAATGKKGKKGLNFKDYNVVLVSFDALQAAHVGSLGYKRNVTPTIDAMAKQGFTFTRNISVASWTVPASMTWFTGVYPSEHGLTNKFSVYNPPNNVLSNLKKLSPNLMTLAEVLHENGYVTGGFTGNAGVGGFFGYDQGFDRYFFEKGKFGSMGISIPKAMDWLKENQGKKFFMFLHGYDCHGQSVPAGGFDYRFVDKGYDRKFTGSAKEQEALREEGLANGSVKLRPEDVDFWRAIYDEKIQRTDAMFKGFVDELQKMGLLDKTIFILTSDHGTEFYEHKRFDHGFSLYDELIHVPLVIRLPGVAAGKVITDQVSSINVMPTILDLLQVKMPERAKSQLRGHSLIPALQGKPVKEDVYAETDYRQYTYKRSVITKDGWKFIYTLENKGRELYNLNKDPHELKNLVEQEPRRAYEMEQMVFAKFKAIGHDLTAKQWIPGLNPVYDSQARGAAK